MTQKELLYIEDAFGHEANIISILDETMSLVQDKALFSFLKNECKKHQAMKARLQKCLEVLAND